MNIEEFWGSLLYTLLTLCLLFMLICIIYA